MSSKFRRVLKAGEQKLQTLGLRKNPPPSIKNVTISNGEVISASTKAALTPRPIPPSLLPPPPPSNPHHAPPEPLPPVPEEIKDPTTETQTMKQLKQFIALLPTLLNRILQRSFNPDATSKCPCGSGQCRTVRCLDCPHSSITMCPNCFISRHRITDYNHWAEVWSSKGFYEKKDISMVHEEGYVTQLGHGGQPCPNPAGDHDIKFTIVDTNGIHQTRLRFCYCKNTGLSRFDQLWDADLIPASVEEPRLAFTKRTLEDFQRHNLDSKENAQDFIKTLRRKTNNVFTYDIPDVTSQFLLVMRFWRPLMAMKRLGHGHSIDRVLGHRPPGNLLVYCPVCPDPHLNMEDQWESTPSKFRHLNQMQLTLDGNHHANKYQKNSDPHDISIFGGRAYFPEDTKFHEYLRAQPQGEEKHSPCPQIKAAGKQDRKKFKNMDVSGIVNIQCSHVLVKASVDLQLGEQFANVDYGLAHALQQTRLLPASTPEGPAVDTSLSDSPPSSSAAATSCDLVFSYDISCSYSVNAPDRFTKNFPQYTDVIKDARWLIPLVHVSNHKEDCEILYSCAYQENAGHFHGETAEQTWAELNHIGAQTRQMNNGHRQDVIIDHEGDWNWQKVSNMALTLRNDNLIAEERVFAKRAHFIGLSRRHVEKIGEWNIKDRYKHEKGKKGELLLVFREHATKVPSQTAIYNAMISAGSSSTSTRKSPRSSSSREPSLAILINEGIQIQRLQRKLQAKLDLPEGEKTGFVKKEIGNLTRSLLKQIGDFRDLQKTVSPSVGDRVAQQVAMKAALGHPERLVLFLPSDFSADDRTHLGLLDLAAVELQMREGEAFDAIRGIQTIVKLKEALTKTKSLARGQAENSATMTRLSNNNSSLKLAMDDYGAARVALISLDGENAEKQWQPLTLADTYRKSTRERRQNGDSKAIDGSLWHMPDMPRKRKAPEIRPGQDQEKRPRLDSNDNATSSAADQEQELKDGWIWSLRQIGNLTEKELEDWLEEKDSVQWYRAEANMNRWLEQWETKQAELLRAIRYFETMSKTWGRLASDHTDQPGHQAYALKKTEMFRRMGEYAKYQITDLGYLHLHNLDGRLLADVMLERRKSLGFDCIVEDILSEHAPEPSQPIGSVSSDASSASVSTS